MILTVLEGRISPDRQDDLKAAYRAAADGPFPRGLVRSTLLREAADPSVWRIATLWESAEALQAMRGTGTPRGVQIFRAAGAEPSTSFMDVVDALAPDVR
jgi:hypothetical protein